MKKLLSFLLTLILLLGLATPASAAKAKAVTMRVQLVEGSVTIKDASGVTLAFFEGMQLYSGYSVETGDDSCAYISLDDSKAIKLDTNTSVTVKKSGRKLQVKLLAGQIVFNVTAPLAGNESLEIRTSTMVTGVRGSSGIVTLRKVIYGTGHGTIYLLDEFGALPKSFEIWGGQLLDLNDSGFEARIREAKVSDFPTLYLKEVEQNEQLQESLNSEGNYSADEMIAEIPAAEAKEQADREKAASAANTEIPANSAEDVIPAFSDDRNTGANTGPVNPVVPIAPGFETVTVIWKNGTVELAKKQVNKGSIPEYIGTEPTRPADEKYTYAFTGWDRDIREVYEDTTYYAEFKSTLRKYKITFVDEGGTTELLKAREYDYGTAAADIAAPAEPTKAADDRYTYTFSGWTPEIADVTADAVYTATYAPEERQPDVYQITWKDGDRIIATSDYAVGAEVSAIDAPEKEGYTFDSWDADIPQAMPDRDLIFNANWTVNKYTVTWKQDDGSVIDTTTVAYGTVPTHADAAKEADAQYTYTFSGWDTEPAAVTGDAEYTATYTRAVNSYTVTWKQDDGSVIDTTTVEYGTVPTHADAGKEADAEYSYTFAGWTPAPTAITGDAAYTAAYTNDANTYTVRWMDGDATFRAESYDFGDAIADPGIPEKTGHTFAEWDAEVPATMPAANLVFNATWTVNKYTVTWKDDNGDVLETDENVPYGTAPSYDGDAPTKEATAQYTYTFAGWTPAIADVTGNATYTATYTSEVNSYILNVVVPTGVSSITVQGQSFTARSADLTYTAAYGTELTVSYEMDDGYISGPATALTAGTEVLAEGDSVSGTFTVTAAADITVSSAYLLLDSNDFADNVIEITVPSAIFGDIETESNINQTADLYIPAGNSLLLWGDMTVNAGTTLTNEGTLTVSEGGVLNNYGTITNDDMLIVTGSGTFNNYSADTLYNNGTLIIDAYGTLNNGGDAGSGRIINGTDALFVNNGSFLIAAGSEMENSGTLILKGSSDDSEFSGTVTEMGGVVYNVGGLCGNSTDLTWYLEPDTNGTYELCITGSGPIQDYISEFDANQVQYSTAPWYPFHESIVSLHLSDGITAIGEYNFYKLRELVTANIPDSVQSIGECAFCDAEKLTGIEIPGSVKTIGKYAFDECFSMTSLTLNEGIETIVDYAFWYCRSLPSVHIPDSVQTMGEYAFSNCDALTELSFGSGLTTIAEAAFRSCTSLEVLTIPDNITLIGSQAFCVCTKLETVNFGSGLTTIANSAFSSCSALQEITIPESVTSLGTSVFYGCTSLTDIHVSEDNPSYSSVNGVVFTKDKTSLIAYPPGKTDASYTIPSGVTAIVDNAFYACSLLQEVSFPDSVVAIGRYAFRDCTELVTLNISNDASQLSTIGYMAFYGCKKLANSNGGNSLIFPKSIQSVGGDAFGECRNLTAVIFIGNDEPGYSIGDSAFYACSSLTTVEFHGNVTSIGSSAFNSTGLTSARFYGDPPSLEGDSQFGYNPTDFTVYYPSNNGNWVISDGKWGGYTAVGFDSALEW